MDQPGPCLWRREQTTQASPVSWCVSRLAYIVHGYECLPFSWWMSESTSCVMAGPLLSSPRSNSSMVSRGWAGGSPRRMRVVTGSPLDLTSAAAAARPLNKPAMSEKSPVRMNWRRPLGREVSDVFINRYDYLLFRQFGNTHRRAQFLWSSSLFRHLVSSSRGEPLFGRRATQTRFFRKSRRLPASEARTLTGSPLASLIPVDLPAAGSVNTKFRRSNTARKAALSAPERRSQTDCPLAGGQR